MRLKFGKISTSLTLFSGVAMLAGLGVAGLAVSDAAAQDKPAIEVVTHAGAGGGTDVNSRMMMLRARRELKQEMVVVNKRGGGGASAMNYFMSRPADGNTILTFTVGHAITMAKGKTELRVEDMAPIARGTNDPQILMIRCDSKYKTPEDFLAGLKGGDDLKWGGTQSGTIDHLTVFLFAKNAGIKMPTYIPFKGGGELATQLVAGAVDVATLNLSEAAAQVESGDICPMIILADQGMAPIPDAKTGKELGVDLVLSTTRGFVTHAGVDKARVAELEAGIQKAMDHSMYKAYLANSGLDETSPQGSEAWGKQIKFMVEAFGPALEEMGLK